jgi:hypothetical protein
MIGSSFEKYFPICRKLRRFPYENRLQSDTFRAIILSDITNGGAFMFYVADSDAEVVLKNIRSPAIGIYPLERLLYSPSFFSHEESLIQLTSVITFDSGTRA